MHHAQAKGLAALGAGSGGAVAAPVVARGPGGGGGASSGPSGKAPPVDARVGARGPTVPYPFSSGIDEDWATLGGACCPCVEATPAQPPVSCARTAAHSTHATTSHTPHRHRHPQPAVSLPLIARAAPAQPRVLHTRPCSCSESRTPGLRCSLGGRRGEGVGGGDRHASGCVFERLGLATHVPASTRRLAWAGP
jgi:hypothetical protein